MDGDRKLFAGLSPLKASLLLAANIILLLAAIASHAMVAFVGGGLILTAAAWMVSIVRYFRSGVSR